MKKTIRAMTLPSPLNVVFLRARIVMNPPAKSVSLPGPALRLPTLADAPSSYGKGRDAALRPWAAVEPAGFLKLRPVGPGRQFCRPGPLVRYFCNSQIPAAAMFRSASALRATNNPKAHSYKPSRKLLRQKPKAKHMKPRFLVLAALMGLVGSGPAVAEREHVTPGDDKCVVPMAEWQPRSKIRELAKQNGWKIRRIKTGDGCYELKGWDRNGVRFEAYIDPKTMEIVSFEYHEEDKEESGRKKNDN